MIFYSNLIYLIFLFFKTIRTLEVSTDFNNECLVKLETDNGVETCFNQNCSDFKDPWRVIYTYFQEEPCYFHYLKLAFSSYDHLIVFSELQSPNDRTLDSFFVDENSKPRTLEIIIDNIYPFNQNYFLREQLLDKLGGTESRIDLLHIEIKHWYRSVQSVVQIIHNDLVAQQPFQQIDVVYPCHARRSIEQLVLVKSLKKQERSSCPTQIKIISNDDLSTPNHTRTQKKKPTKTHQNQNEHVKSDSFNQSDSYYKSNTKSSQSNLIAKIVIVSFIVAVIIAIVVYRYVYSSSSSTET